MSDPLIGATLAGYRIDTVIGYGGMGVVYLAEHLGLQRKVALKLIAPHLSRDVEFQQRFEHEARAAASVDHPNVIPVYDYQQFDNELIMTMRFVDGWDLRTLIRAQGALPVERGIRLIAQAAAGLDAAHARGLVHRDVKPANILIEPRAGEEHVYVTDFGLAKGAASVSLTATGGFVGTPDYASPEQISPEPDQPTDHRTDIYSLGCVLFETLSGRPPYPRQTEIAKAYAHMNASPPALSEAVPDLPKPLDAVVQKALAKDPDDRYPSARDLGRAVVEAGRGQVAPRRRVPEPQPTPRRPTARNASSTTVTRTTPAGRVRRLTRRQMAIAVSLAVLLVAGGVAALALIGDGGADETTGPNVGPPTAKLSTTSVRSALGDYQQAYAREDLAILRRLLSSDVRRTNDNRTVSGEHRVLAQYADQFARLARPDYRLYYSVHKDVRLHGRKGVVKANYDVAESGHCAGSGAIAFHMTGANTPHSAPRIDAIDITTDASPSCRDIGSP